MNRSFLSILDSSSLAERHEVLKEREIDSLPILNGQGNLVELFLASQISPSEEGEKRSAVIVAGGLGSRLGNLTSQVPKPMLKVGEKPLLEILVDRLIRQGFSRLFIAVNYKADQIKTYFGDGNSKGISIEYLEEPKRLGTAGCLSLLPKDLDQPVLVTNADLLTKINYGLMMEWHKGRNSLATVGVRRYALEVPYGSQLILIG